MSLSGPDYVWNIIGFMYFTFEFDFEINFKYNSHNVIENNKLSFLTATRISDSCFLNVDELSNVVGCRSSDSSFSCT